MYKPWEVTYSVYIDRKGIKCITCPGCETHGVKGWCGKELCSVPVDGDDDDDGNSHSLDDSSMPPLLRREDNCSDDD
jgi:hypothetical protein